MATPIAHSLAGCAVFSFSRKAKEREWLNLVLLCAVIANAPDLDFLPGIIMGKPALYHQGITHSIGFALLTSLIVAGIYSFKGKPFPAIFSLCFFSYLSHLFIDLFGGSDVRPPYGIPLFWPLSGEHFISPVPLFLGVHHAAYTSASTIEWFEGVFSLYNLGAITLEVTLVLPLVFLGRRYRKNKCACSTVLAKEREN